MPSIQETRAPLTLTRFFQALVQRGLSDSEAAAHLLYQIEVGRLVVNPPLPRPCRLEPKAGGRLLVAAGNELRDGDAFTLTWVRGEPLLKPSRPSAHTQAAIAAMYPDEGASAEAPAHVTPEPVEPKPHGRRPSGAKELGFWKEIALHFDRVVADPAHGPFLSFGSARDTIKLELQARKLALPHDRTIERWIRRNRPGWVRGA